MEFDQKIKTDQGIFRQDQDIANWCTSMGLNPSKIKEFIKKGKAAALVKLKDTEKAKMGAHIKHLDPYNFIDKLDIEDLITDIEVREEYKYELHRPAEGVSEDQFDYCVQERQERIKLNEIAKKNNVRLGHLKEYKDFLEEIKNKLYERKEISHQEELKWIEHETKLKFNYEVIIYMRQGQVEIPQ